MPTDPTPQVEPTNVLRGLVGTTAHVEVWDAIAAFAASTNLIQRERAVWRVENAIRGLFAHALAAQRASVSAEHEKREREALQHIAALLKGADEYDGEPWMERARAFLARTKGADDGE